ncbi:MAG: 50S ribosomal protein L10 [Spirochaetaceae bacterium]|jgi:large subunit ribosomal protein L10|nr:50S ribosomal protein L10 [Spirochaetaceae bacterium]
MAIVAKKEQEYKVKAVGELKEMFGALSNGSPADFLFTDYRGLTVAQITALRRQLRGKEAAFKVVKNNFARIAFQQLKAPDVSGYLRGPTAVAIALRDSNEVAKILLDFAKEAPVLKVKGGLVGNTVYTGAQVEAFSKLPGRLELISMFMSVINGPVRNFATALNDIPARLVRTIKAAADKKSESAA